MAEFVTEETITGIAADRWSTASPRRLGEVLSAAVRHLHAFAREVQLTEAEWMAAVQWLTAVGQMSDEKRQEFILASDVFGLSMLVVQMNNRFEGAATPATVLGPFHIPDSPIQLYGGDMSKGVEGQRLYVKGTLTNTDGDPVPNAILDVWQADTAGVYEAQLGEVDEARLRARYRTEEDGSYCVKTVAPLGYSIPMDGPVGSLIGKTKITPMRPAHIHFMIDVPGYRKLITHLFKEDTEYLESDVVFGVKGGLIVPFVPVHSGAKLPDGTDADGTELVATYNFVIQKRAQ